MTKLKTPANCIDETREMRDSGMMISLIGDNVWRAFPAKAAPAVTREVEEDWGRKNSK